MRVWWEVGEIVRVWWEVWEAVGVWWEVGMRRVLGLGVWWEVWKTVGVFWELGIRRVRSRGCRVGGGDEACGMLGYMVGGVGSRVVMV